MTKAIQGVHFSVSTKPLTNHFCIRITTSEDMYPIVLGIKRAIFGELYVEWNVVRATAILAMLPTALVVVAMQKWFVKGLVETEK